MSLIACIHSIHLFSFFPTPPHFQFSSLYNPSLSSRIHLSTVFLLSLSSFSVILAISSLLLRVRIKLPFFLFYSHSRHFNESVCHHKNEEETAIRKFATEYLSFLGFRKGKKKCGNGREKERERMRDARERYREEGEEVRGEW